jgi:ABC-type Fe3+-hydroxamate transport system substrate-binding protein
VKPGVVSLVPSVTETLLAWDVEVVACTRFCEQPDIRHVGGTKDPDVVAIAELKPDVVIVDTEENRLEDHDALVTSGLNVHVTSVRSLQDVPATLDGIADAVGVPRPAPIEFGPSPPSPVAAFIPVWRRPWMTVNGLTYTSTVLAAAGVGNVFADHPDRYPTVTDEEVEAAGPAMVVAPSEPYPFAERHRVELKRFSADVRFVDGQDVTWWGVRTPAAIGRLRESLHRPQS